MSLLTRKTMNEKGNSLKRFTFEIRKNGKAKHTHSLILNPEEFVQNEPARVKILKTLGGAYAEEWGKDLVSISIKGTTGYKAKVNIDGKTTDGFQSFKDLRNNVYRYFLEPDNMPKQLARTNDEYELRFHNWEDDEHYIIMPEKFDLLRNKNRPLLYAYDFKFTCLCPVGYKQNIMNDSIYEKTIDLDTQLSELTTALAVHNDNILLMLGGITL